MTTRAHDLPPTWDGRPVTWHGWDAGPPVIMCPPPNRECCQFCGSLEAAVGNRGSRREDESGQGDHRDDEGRSGAQEEGK